MTVRMTKRAAEEFKTVCSSKSLPIDTTKMRVEAERDENDGKLRVSLGLDDNEPDQEDVVEDTDGAQLVIKKSLAELLGEVRVDYKEERGGFLLERGITR